MYRDVKRLYLLLTFLFFLGACSSQSDKKTSKDPIKSSELPTRLKSRVEIKNDDGSVSAVNLPGSKSTVIYDPKTGKRFKSDGWVDPTKYESVAGKHLRKLSSTELISLSKDASAREVTLIIEELRSRREKGVSGLAAILDDNRKAVFKKGREYWWYEKKSEPAEDIELRVYAAYALQFTLRKFPSGVVMDMTKDRMFYAVKDQYAVVKEDLIKVWKEWWSQAKNDY